MLWYLTVTALLQLGASAEVSRIYDQRTGEEISLEALADELARRDVVFLGEEHGNPAGHRLQQEIVQALQTRRPDLVIALEMFERDVQAVLDDYLQGRIDENAFLANSRPWENYHENYRPVVEFARERQLDVLAANVPRAAARAVSEGKKPSREDRPFLPRHTTAPKDDYWERFVEQMKGHVGTGEPEAMKRYYRAQCLKDDAMAETITDYLARHPHRRPLVVHLCGKFHSDYGHGAVWRVLQRRPLLQAGVVSLEVVEDPDVFDAAEHRLRSHFLLAVPRRCSSTPVAAELRQ